MDLKGKIVILLISFLIQFSLSGQQIIEADYYFDSVNGNDNNSGTNTNDAWQTIDKFNSMTFNPGNVIAFRDSMEYRGRLVVSNDGTDDNRITVTNWYSNASNQLPLFLASEEISNWNDQGNNIWSTNASVSNSMWFVFADSARWGRPKNSLSNLTKEFDYYSSGSSLSVYSTENPTIRYVSVEIENEPECVMVNGKYITIQHIEARYGYGDGMNAGQDDDEAWFLDNRSLYNGYGDYDGGNGIANWSTRGKMIRNYTYDNSSHGLYIYSTGATVVDAIVDSNICINNHHSGIDINGSGGMIRGTKIRYNIIYDEPWNWYVAEVGDGQAGMFIAGQHGTGHTSNTTIAYNLIFNTYAGSIHLSQDADSVLIYNNTLYNPKVSNCIVVDNNPGNLVVIKNNIGYSISNAPLEANDDYNRFANNNFWYRPSGDIVEIVGIGSFSDHSMYTNATGWDANGSFDNPLLNNPVSDFGLQSSSGCINAAEDLGFLHDINGQPIIGNPDIGAYEYNPTSSVGELEIDPVDVFTLSNYPNPFNPTTRIQYTISNVNQRLVREQFVVRLKVYDVLGNEVATLVEEEKSPGIYEVEFDGSGLSSGIYLYQLHVDNYILSNAMVLIK